MKKFGIIFSSLVLVTLVACGNPTPTPTTGGGPVPTVEPPATPPATPPVTPPTPTPPPPPAPAEPPPAPAWWPAKPAGVPANFIYCPPQGGVPGGWKPIYAWMLQSECPYNPYVQGSTPTTTPSTPPVHPTVPPVVPPATSPSTNPTPDAWVPSTTRPNLGTRLPTRTILPGEVEALSAKYKLRPDEAKHFLSCRSLADSITYIDGALRLWGVTDGDLNNLPHTVQMGVLPTYACIAGPMPGGPGK